MVGRKRILDLEESLSVLPKVAWTGGRGCLGAGVTQADTSWRSFSK